MVCNSHLNEALSLKSTPQLGAGLLQQQVVRLPEDLLSVRHCSRPKPALIYQFLQQPSGVGSVIPTAQRKQQDGEVRNLPNITESGGWSPTPEYYSAGVSGIRTG